MKITKCDLCKKIIEGKIYDLAITNTSSVIENSFHFDICGDCFKELCKKLTNKEENENDNT